MKDDTFSEHFFNLKDELNYKWNDVKKRRIILEKLRNLIDKYLEELKDE